MPISSGIMFLMYRLGRLMVWYIRNAIAQDRGAGNRKPEKPGRHSSEGGEVASRLTDNEIVEQAI